MIRYNGISILEEIVYVFFVGYIHGTPNKNNLSSKDILEIVESISKICPNLNNIFKRSISRSLILQIDVIEKILEWQTLTKGPKIEWYAELQRARQQRSPIKVSEEMKFAFLLGMSKWHDSDNEKITNARKLFLSNLPKDLCPNTEEDRLQDIRGFFNDTPIIFEIQEKIIQLENGRLEWSSDYYDDEEPVNEEERMLRKFQEDNK